MVPDTNSEPLAKKMLRAFCMGYAVLFLGYFALACGATSWESFFPRYRVPQTASGLRSAGFALLFLVAAFGVAFRQRWARWASIAFGALGLCFSGFLFWDGYLRVKAKYSGEESSEVFGAIVFSATSLLFLAALIVPIVKKYFDAKPLGDPSIPRSTDSAS